MLKEHVIQLKNGEGLHARPAGLFVKTANQFKSAVEVELNGIKKNGKSIMSLMTLGATQGDALKLYVSGEDSDAAIAALTALVESNFGA